MRPRWWLWMWLWLAGLGVIDSAPRPEKVKAEGTESLRFIDRPDFFDYPDSDTARVLALSQFIGENPDIFVDSDSSSDFFHCILVAALVLAFIFLLLQFCIHM
ncbi:PREDICTED: uncharacterized protein C16orf92 homolog [Chrysochloris asiatica]|uniref:Uncharacterized protein C16orf92 homolog n=1 Tax=Chrysochloris asiatica TaxID=185453 RepID=A0A9B0UA65_CHRAS|nr:PREDICTED: uncharacterized protein C16orf92 homolog [Chrysochloris asiatica]